MLALPDAITHKQAVYRPFLERLARLFAEMDSAWTAVAERHRFHCSGCADNCCLTLFFHHTLLEYLLLQQGFSGLDSAEREAVRSRAKAVVRDSTAADGGRIPAARRMCPLNTEGLCRLYAQRPMICRLHGIPHMLQRPDGKMIRGSGCVAFEDLPGAGPGHCLDRTPYYRRMAELEQRLQRAAGLERPLRLRVTVAEMVVSFPNPQP